MKKNLFCIAFLISFSVSNLFICAEEKSIDDLLFKDRDFVDVNSETGEIVFPDTISERDRQEILEMLDFEKMEKLPPLIYLKQLNLIDAQLKTLSDMKGKNSKESQLFKRAYIKNELQAQQTILKQELKNFFKSHPNYSTNHPSFDKKK